MRQSLGNAWISMWPLVNAYVINLVTSSQTVKLIEDLLGVCVFHMAVLEFFSFLLPLSPPLSLFLACVWLLSLCAIFLSSLSCSLCPSYPISSSKGGLVVLILSQRAWEVGGERETGKWSMCPERAYFQPPRVRDCHQEPLKVQSLLTPIQQSAKTVYNFCGISKRNNHLKKMTNTALECIF